MDRTLEQELNNRKSLLVTQIAKQFGLPVIDINVIEADPRGFLGMPDLSVNGALNEAIDRVVEQEILRCIKVGDTVLMEIADDVMETVIIEEVLDGIAYGLGDDGEPFCAPLNNCDKVPF